jgi:hypothetical protein
MAVQSKHSDTSTSTADRDANDFYHGQKLELWGEEYTYDCTKQKWRNRFGALENLRYNSATTKRGEQNAQVVATTDTRDLTRINAKQRSAMEKETRVGLIERELRSQRGGWAMCFQTNASHCDYATDTAN